MADTKITALTALTAADPANDVIPIVDVSDTTMAASGTTKKISVNNILGASGTATLASATITGDLTVDTNTLKVDSANNRVGVGTASPSSQFHIFNSGATTDTYLEIQNGSASTYIGTRGTTFGAMDAGDSYIFNSSGNDIVLMAANASGAIKFAAGGNTESMRLNSTGLGVGVNPGSAIGNLQVGGSSNANLYVQQGTDTIRMGVRASGRTGIILDSSNATYTNRAWYLDNVGSSGSLVIGRQGLDVITFDNSGNCGIGVQPSAGGGCLQLKSGITFPATQVASSDANTLDDYEEGTWTATLKGSVSDPTTPVTATGRYTKIGRQVSIQLFVNNVTTTGASGRIQIDGLPFANNGSVESISNVGFYNMATFTGVPFGLTSASSTVIDMWSSVSAGVFQAVNYNPGSVQYVWVNLTYTV